MDIAGFSNAGNMSFVILPVCIFFIRILDVSVGTLRIIFVSKDIRLYSALLGFVEVLIWLFAITQIMENLNSPIHYIAYAAGFGMGNYVGVSIERRLSMGNRTLRIITSKDAADLIIALRSAGYGVTSLKGEGVTGAVKIIFTVIKRNEIAKITEIIKNFNPKAFYTVEEVWYVKEGNVYPNRDRGIKARMGRLIAKKK